MERDVQEGHGDGAEPVASNADENEATSIGKIIASLVAELGADRAMMWEGYVNFGERRVDGDAAPLRRSDQRARVGNGHEPLNSASVCEQRTRPHFAQRGIRSR